jgi:hypothetical protein
MMECMSCHDLTSLANTSRVQIRISFTKSSLDLGAQLTTVTRALS